MDVKSLIDYGTSLTFYLGIIFIVIATLIYVRKRVNDLDAKANSMFDIISTMAREIQYMKAAISGGGGGGGGHPQGMNLETALNADDKTKDVLMSHFQAGINGDESSNDDDDNNDESSDDESSDDESSDDSDNESDGENDGEIVDIIVDKMTLKSSSTINDIDGDDEVATDAPDAADDVDDDDVDDDDFDDDVDDVRDKSVKLIEFNESSIIDSELNDVDLTDYTKKTTKELKELVFAKGLVPDVSRIKRPQLIKLLQNE